MQQDNQAKREFGERLKDALKRFKVNKVELANEISISPSYLGKIESGVRCPPSEIAKKVIEKLQEQGILSKEEAGELMSAHERARKQRKVEQYSQELSEPNVDWEDIPEETGGLEERSGDLGKLRDFIIMDHCRLAGILGPGGIGKTSFAIEVIKEQLWPHFHYIFVRSLKDAAPLALILRNCLEFLGDTLPPSLEEQINLLFRYLKEKRCLIVLDNVETILQPDSLEGDIDPKYEDYAKFFRRIATTKHQSCVLITSREQPSFLKEQEATTLSVRSLRLRGLSVPGVKVMLLKQMQRRQQGNDLLYRRPLHGSEENWQELVDYYGGIPLMLTLIYETIASSFAYDIARFLPHKRVYGTEVLIKEQIGRLSPVELLVSFWLAIEREPVDFENLRKEILPRVDQEELDRALRSLHRRYLIEEDRIEEDRPGFFTLQPVIMQAVTDIFIGHIIKAVKQGAKGDSIHMLRECAFFICYPLIKATAKDYIREIQIRLILQPIAERLVNDLGVEKVRHGLRHWISSFQKEQASQAGYSVGNALNLLFCLQRAYPEQDFLRGIDCSYTVIRQADMRDVTMHDANFAHATFVDTRFTEAFGDALSLKISHNGMFLATGTTSHEVWLRRRTDGTVYRRYLVHSDWVRAVAFSPDDRFLASGSDDKTVAIIEIEKDMPPQYLAKHTGRVRTVAFHPKHNLLLASAGDDRTIRIWNYADGQCLHTLEGHEHTITSITFMSDGSRLISVGLDGKILAWDTNNWQAKPELLSKSEYPVRNVTCSPKGHLIAWAGDDCYVTMRDMQTGQVRRLLHPHALWSLAFSADGRLLASGSEDGMLRLWEVHNAQPVEDQKPLAAQKAHYQKIGSLTFAATGPFLATSSEDRTARLWEIEERSGRYSCHCTHGFQGQYSWNRALTFSRDSQLLTYGSSIDNGISIWKWEEGTYEKLYGHAGWTRTLAFNPVIPLLASSGEDQTVRFWQLATRKGYILQKNLQRVWCLAFSPDGKTLAAASEDTTIILWDVDMHEQIVKAGSRAVLTGHGDQVKYLAFSSDGQLLVSVSDDCTLRIWDMQARVLRCTLAGHTAPIWSLALGSEQMGHLAVSAGEDQRVLLWDIKEGSLVKELGCHTKWIRSVAFCPGQSIVASASDDGTIGIWNIETGSSTYLPTGKSVRSVAFPPNGRYLASSYLGNTIDFWPINADLFVPTKTTPYKTLTTIRPYEGLNITGVHGLSEPEIANLEALGAQ